MKYKEPYNYLLPNLPDYVGISKAFYHLNKRQPTMKEIREIQKVWFEDRKSAAQKE